MSVVVTCSGVKERWKSQIIVWNDSFACNLSSLMTSSWAKVPGPKICLICLHKPIYSVLVPTLYISRCHLIMIEQESLLSQWMCDCNDDFSAPSAWKFIVIWVLYLSVLFDLAIALRYLKTLQYRVTLHSFFNFTPKQLLFFQVSK